MTVTDTTGADRLAVYGTNGEEFYPDPDGGSGHPEVSEWFLTTGLRCSLDTGEGTLMTYLGDVRHPHDLDQVFAIYEQAESGSAVIDGCQNAVRQRLVDQEGWQLVESTTSNDVKSMYHLLVEGARDSDIWVSDYTAHEASLVQDVLRSEKTDPVHVQAGDYRVASRLVRSYADIDPVRVHVYNERNPRLTSDVDLAISVELGPYQVKVPDSTIRLLDELEQQRERVEAQNRLESTVEAITTHAENDDDFSLVREAVEQGVQDGYGEYELIERPERKRLQAELSETQAELRDREREVDRLEQELRTSRKRAARLENEAVAIERLGRLEHWLTDRLKWIALLLAIAVVVIAITWLPVWETIRPIVRSLRQDLPVVGIHLTGILTLSGDPCPGSNRSIEQDSRRARGDGAVSSTDLSGRTEHKERRPCR